MASGAHEAASNRERHRNDLCFWQLRPEGVIRAHPLLDPPDIGMRPSLRASGQRHAMNRRGQPKKERWLTNDAP